MSPSQKEKLRELIKRAEDSNTLEGRHMAVLVKAMVDEDVTDELFDSSMEELRGWVELFQTTPR